eukprot:TRINITY_DN10956_c1_g1_i1.p1 TRINITY_DN10956_c1_g1~~TRINITY_DN10956_c1_g1_i1.p1  ORF type:complete len:173 (-),score=35.43 TRINITY_DN10956_c1_g1_i1:384-902(-)
MSVSGSILCRQRSQVRRTISSEEIKEIREAFDIFDQDKNGKLKYRELKVAIRALGFPVKKQEVLQILKQFNKVEEDSIDFDEFKDILEQKILQRDPAEELAHAFQLFDVDNSGKISFRNLKAVVKEVGLNIDDEELVEMIEEFDLDKDGQISAEEFGRILKSYDLEDDFSES